MPELDLNSIPQNAGEAEALINGFQEPETEQPTPSPEVAPQEYAINYKGKEEKYPLEKLIQFAQQGRDYSQRMSEYNTRLKTDLDKALATERQKWAPIEEKFKRYSEVEDYIKKDPAWWDHVQSLYQQRLSGQAPNGANTPPDPAIKALIDQAVAPLRDYVQTAQQREEAQQRESEDRALDAKVAEAREKYAQFDWVTVDEKGQNLEQRILAHAMTLGLGSKPEHFDLALKHLLHDDFVKRAEVSTKEDVGKGLQKVTKLGLGPVTERRQLALKPVANVSSKSWDEITQEAKEAAGL